MRAALDRLTRDDEPCFRDSYGERRFRQVAMRFAAWPSRIGHVTDQNYLRGVQEADSSGKVTFTSIFPAAYSGRWPHIHFMASTSLESDNVFKDGHDTQLATVTGDVASGYTATLAVSV